MAEQLKLLWLSDSPLCPTGYSTISLNLLNRLSSKGWDTHYMAHNLHSQDLIRPKAKVIMSDGIEIKSSLYGAGSQPYCKELIMPRIQKIRPDVYCTLLDSFMVFPWYFTELNFSPAHPAFYYPSDGGGILPIGCENVLKKMEMPIAMSKFAQKQAYDIYGIKSEYVPHATDPDFFTPINKDLKRELRQTAEVMNLNNQLIRGILTDKFVVGVNARNQGRKMLDRTIKTFAIFAKDAPDAVLFMHLDVDDAAQAFNMRELIVRYKLQNRVFFSGMKFFNSFPYEKMPDVYRLMDIYLSSTSGEGFGICTIEALSTGIPVIITDYTTSAELIKDNGLCGELVPISSEITGGWNVERGVMDIEEGAKSLLKLYNNPALIEKYSKIGRQKVIDCYNWDLVTNQFDKLFRRLSCV